MASTKWGQTWTTWPPRITGSWGVQLLSGTDPTDGLTGLLRIEKQNDPEQAGRQTPLMQGLTLESSSLLRLCFCPERDADDP